VNRPINKRDSGSIRLDRSKPPKVFAVKDQRPVFFTPGFLVLVVFIIICSLTLISPLAMLTKTYARNAELNQELEVLQSDYEIAQIELAKWNDPNYLITQARESLGYVRKGEVKVSLIGDLDSILPAPDSTMTAQLDPPTKKSPLTWYQRLLESFS
jgi:cell division protein FtsB